MRNQFSIIWGDNLLSAGRNRSNSDSRDDNYPTGRPDASLFYRNRRVQNVLPVVLFLRKLSRRPGTGGEMTSTTLNQISHFCEEI